MTKEQFRLLFKRILRQLSQRNQAVANKRRPESHYQNKRKEFIDLIDSAIESGWFIMPKKGTRIYNIYHDKWA